MIVFGYKYPGWNEKEQTCWKVQSTVEINPGFNILWVSFRIRARYLLSALQIFSPLLSDQGPDLYDHIGGLPDGWLLFGFGEWGSVAEGQGESGEWCQSYYVPHSFSVTSLRVTVSLSERSLFWSFGLSVYRSVNVLFLIPSWASGVTGPTLMNTKCCT